MSKMQPKKLVCDLGNVINNSRSVMSKLDITQPKTTFPIEFAGAFSRSGAVFKIETQSEIRIASLKLAGAISRSF